MAMSALLSEGGPESVQGSSSCCETGEAGVEAGAWHGPPLALASLTAPLHSSNMGSIPDRPGVTCWGMWWWLSYGQELPAKNFPSPCAQALGMNLRCSSSLLHQATFSRFLYDWS